MNGAIEQPATTPTPSSSAPDHLVRLIRARRTPDEAPRVNLEPATAYEAITRQMVDDLVREVTAIRSRLDSIFYIVIGSIVVDVFVRLAG